MCTCEKHEKPVVSHCSVVPMVACHLESMFYPKWWFGDIGRALPQSFCVGSQPPICNVAFPQCWLLEIMPLAASSNPITPCFFSRYAYSISSALILNLLLKYLSRFLVELASPGPYQQASKFPFRKKAGSQSFPSPLSFSHPFPSLSWVMHEDPVLSVKGVLDLETLLSCTLLSPICLIALGKNIKFKPTAF